MPLTEEDDLLPTAATDGRGSLPTANIDGPEAHQGSDASGVDEELSADGLNDKYHDQCGQDFYLAMMLFIMSANLSTNQYEALTEVLAFATQATINSLPRSLVTLHERCRKSFPLLQIKGKLVDVELQSIPPQKKTPRHVYYFGPFEYYQLWLSSPSTRASIYQGIGVRGCSI